MLKIIYNFIPKFDFNSNQYEYCDLEMCNMTNFVLYIYIICFYLYCNIFYLYADSLTSYCITLKNCNTKLYNNLLSMYLMA